MQEELTWKLIEIFYKSQPAKKKLLIEEFEKNLFRAKLNKFDWNFSRKKPVEWKTFLSDQVREATISPFLSP